MIKIGLKSNANFLFEQMRGDTLGGTTGKPYFLSIIHLTKKQIKRFESLIWWFDGDIEKSLIKTKAGSFIDHVDYECCFVKN